MHSWRGCEKVFVVFFIGLLSFRTRRAIRKTWDRRLEKFFLFLNFGVFQGASHSPPFVWEVGICGLWSLLFY